MKKILAFACLLSLGVAAQNHGEACDVFLKVEAVLQKEHFKPKPVDDSLSAYVFNNVMEHLDENRMVFLKEDYDRLAVHKYQIDDYLKNKDCAFFYDFITVYRKALERNKDIITEINAVEFLDTRDSMYYSKKAFPYRPDTAKLKTFVRKKIVYDIFEDVAKLSRNKDSLQSKLPELSRISREKIIDTYLCRIDGILSPEVGFEKSIYHEFYNVFCSYFDPHTAFFSYNEKAAFLSTISSQNYSLGIYVSQNEKEEIIVEEIVPGGPAYKTQIDKGDQIVKLASENREYPVSCASIETINAIVSSDLYKKVELTLRKNDGTVYSVNLEKKIMKAEDNSVYSYIVGKENPIGYINIPSFYTSMDDGEHNGVADDVAKELLKLKEENIQGLIIDMQYNGGGSMDEVVRLAGMFIDFGPLSIIVDRNDNRTVVKDYNRGSLYNGPIVLLVNGFSASASEFFAGIMQDYNRAIIAGNKTLGKATMQTILPVNTKNTHDFVKVTIDKFYRVTGKSSQYNGIEPDIEMPAYLDKLLPRESSMPTALKNDTLRSRLKFTPLSNTLFKEVMQLSEDRIKTDTDFNSIAAVSNQIEQLYEAEKAPVALTFENVYDDIHALDATWKNINEASEKEHNAYVRPPRSTYQKIMYDDFLSNANEYRIKLVKTNPYVRECVNILNDINRFNPQ